VTSEPVVAEPALAEPAIRASDYPDEWGAAVSWIEGFLLDHRYAPTLREQAKAMRWSSIETAHRTVHDMQAHGFLTLTPRAPRTMAVTRKGRRLIGGRARDIIEGISEGTSPRG
jgi:SOS-response transcriptional repressor LexA